MKIGMMNNPANDIYDEIIFAGENNFDFIDLTIEPPKAQIKDIDIKKIRNLCNKYNLEIIGHTNFYLMWASPIKRMQKASIDELYDHFQVFHKLGIKKVNIHAHWFQPNSKEAEILERIINSLKKISVFTENLGLKLMLENLPNGFLNKSEPYIGIFKEIPALYFNLDVCHAQEEVRNNTEKYLSLFGNKLIHVHFSDKKPGENHLPLGKGMIDWNKIIKLLKKHNYNDSITLEVFTKGKMGLLESKEKLMKIWDNNTSLYF